MSLSLSSFIREQNRIQVGESRASVVYQLSRNRPNNQSMIIHDRAYNGRPEFRWSNREETHRQEFNIFKHQKKSFHCAICSCLLYETEIFTRECKTPLHKLPCNEWGRPPIVIRNKARVMVCKDHKEGDEASPYVHPGPIPVGSEKLNYIERSFLSPIKILSRITRNTMVSTNHDGGRYGHYEMSGSVVLQHSYDFAHMLYSGTLGMAYCREKRGKTRVDLDKVRRVFHALKLMNPLIANFELPSFSRPLMEYHLKTNEAKFPGWNMNMLMPLEDSPVTASHLELSDLVIGTNMMTNSKIFFGNPSLFALCFVHLYTTGTGHYSLWSREETDPNIAEYNGGKAEASKNGETLKSYTKRCLRSMDRRFAMDYTFLFVMLDTIERHNIQARNVFLATTRGRTLKQSDIVNPDTGNYRSNEVSTVGSQIRSSYAYKRSNYYDLSAMFRKYGEPTLFFTVTCDDFSTHVKRACGLNDPWSDPELFATHFKRVWQEFFSHYVLEVFARQIGGIEEWSWVLEVQSRGSPHVHCILWTTATTQDLIERNVVVAQIPKEDEDPDLRALVLRYQQHFCSSYCTPAGSAVCRFGYPFAPRERTEVDGDRVKYKRNGDEGYINSYNPFFLRLLESNMDMQINNGRRALHYLAKYLTKHDISTGIQFEADDSSLRTSDFHFKHRVVGSVEAIYDIMGYDKQRSSRGCIHISLNLPDYDRRLLRRNIRDLDPESTDIFADTHVQKYCQRSPLLANLNIKQYYMFYRVVRTTEEAEFEFNDSMEMDVARDIEEEERWLQEIVESSGGNAKRRVQDEGFDEELPVFVRDTRNRQFSLRKRFPVIRHASPTTANGEVYFYSQIVLQYPCFDYNALYREANSSWQDLFFTMVRSGSIENVHNVREEDILQGIEVMTDDMKQRRLNEMLDSASESQKSIYETILQNSHLGLHVVIGAAGTGKSYLLNMLYLKYSLLGYTVVKLAPTGIASRNINGSTLHSFFGLHADDSDVYNPLTLDTHFKRHPKTLLLIDECSMISRRLAGVLNSALIETLQRFSFFGNVETCFFGDLAQLPPVVTRKSQGRGSFYDSPLFQRATKLVLREPQRQTDSHFIHILGKVRVFSLDNEVRDFIWSRMRNMRDIPHDAVRLYCTNERVDRANWSGLRRLTGIEWKIEAEDYFRGSMSIGKGILKTTHLHQELLLKKNAPLLLLHNIDVSTGWTNGALLKLLDYDEQRGLKVKLLSTGASRWIERITRIVPVSGFRRSQFPVRLAFATTIHKSQSLTLNKVAIEYASMQAHGQLYVAMSRVKTAQDIFFFAHKVVQNTHIDLPVDIGAITVTQELERQ